MKFYNVTDYGISQSSENNTPALQKLVDSLKEKGGVIFFPNGIYKFNSSHFLLNRGNMEVGVYWTDNISILGQSMSGTILKMCGNSLGGKGYSLFSYFDLNRPICGCKFENFTVDGYDCLVEEYKHQGKAFYFQNVKDCIFQNLKIVGTPATGLGIDFIDNVMIDSIYCENCGRLWTYKTGHGGAGIGIGTGLSSNENFILRNCITNCCGHFGIFVEDQSLFHINDKSKHPMGMIISNNICRNGRYAGIGVRGGKNILISNNLSYENNDAGIEIDYIVTNCQITGNGVYNNKFGIRVCNDSIGEKKNIFVHDNQFMDNEICFEFCDNSGIYLSNNQTEA